MPIDATCDGYRSLIEARREIDGRFTNLKFVGDGYSSLVFSARDELERQNVAVKVFRPDRLSGDTYRYQCFCREATLLKQLVGTKNVLSLVAGRGEFVETLSTPSGISIALNFPFYVAELAQADVADLIRRNVWTAEEKLVNFREMCKSIQRIHRMRIVHRDIKPGNFVLLPSGGLKIADFGTARDLGGDDPAIFLNYQYPPGDTRYAAPEMMALLHDGDPEIAFLGDIYSLGATLYELWSGTILGVQLFNPRFAMDLATTMNAVRKSERRRVYMQFVQNISRGHSLPRLTPYGSLVPSSIWLLVDDLYRAMTALDFRERLADFERIFLRLDQCLIVLRNEDKVCRWREQKRLRRLNRHEKDSSHHAVIDRFRLIGEIS